MKTEWEVLVNLKTREAKLVITERGVGSTTVQLNSQEAREIGRALVEAAEQLEQRPS